MITSVKITDLPLLDAEALGFNLHRRFRDQFKGNVEALNSWLKSYSSFDLRQSAQLMLLAIQLGALPSEGFEPKTTAEALEILELNNPAEDFENPAHIGWELLRGPGLIEAV